MCCVETHILPGQEDFYADADTVGSGAGRIIEARQGTADDRNFQGAEPVRVGSELLSSA